MSNILKQFITINAKHIVQDACAFFMAKWEIIAREFLTLAYISISVATPLLDYCFGYVKEKHCQKNETLAIFSGSNPRASWSNIGMRQFNY